MGPHAPDTSRRSISKSTSAPRPLVSHPRGQPLLRLWHSWGVIHSWHHTTPPTFKLKQLKHLAPSTRPRTLTPEPARHWPRSNYLGVGASWLPQFWQLTLALPTGARQGSSYDVRDETEMGSMDRNNNRKTINEAGRLFVWLKYLRVAATLMPRLTSRFQLKWAPQQRPQKLSARLMDFGSLTQVS